MTLADALGRIGEGERGGVFFLFGDDEFRKDEAARALVEAHLDPATRDFNYDLLRGSEVDVERLASVLATPPLMASWRVVLVREAEGLAPSAATRDVVLQVAEDPPPGLALILQTSIPRGSRARFYSQLRAKARTLEFPGVDENDVPGWLLERARDRYGLPMDEEAARALAAAVGTDLGVLAQEMDKLASLAEEAGRIGLEHVERAGTRIPRQDRWRWFDLVGERRFGEALEGLGVLLAQGESGVGLTIGLSTHLLRLGTAADQGARALEALLPPHQRWLARRLDGQARRWSVAEIEEALLGLRRVDQLLKASGLGDRNILEEWLLGEMVRAGAAATA